MPPAGPSGYFIENAVLFDGTSGYLSITPSAGNRKVHTLSVWLKQAIGPTSQAVFSCSSSGTNYSELTWNNSRFENATIIANVLKASLKSAALTRDYAGWVHIVEVAEFSNATAADRHKRYINGVEVTDWNTKTNPATSNDSWINAGLAHRLGLDVGGGQYWAGYMADAVFIDGLALTASSFGEFNDAGIWTPKSPKALTFGTNGFWLDFAASGDLGNDVSGNANDWTKNGTITQVKDTPSDKSENGTANYATISPLDRSSFSTSMVLTNGNLTVVDSSTKNSWGISSLRMEENSGIYYAEFTAGADIANLIMGICGPSRQYTVNRTLYQEGDGYGYLPDGRYANNNVYESPGDRATWASGDIIGIEMDTDNGSINWWKNGNDEGQGYTGVSGPYFFASAQEYGGTGTWAFNPADMTHFDSVTNAQALSTDNITRNQSGKLADHFEAVLWAGDNTSPRTITCGFGQADFVWMKNRDYAGGGGHNHLVFDAVRGFGVSKEIATSGTFEEGSSTIDTANYGYVASHASGFSLVAGTTNDNYTNDSTICSSMVAWCIKAASTASGSTTGAGTAKTYTTQYNPDLGFAIIEYVGNGTAGHSIPVPAMTDPKAPFFTVHKKTSAAADWTCWHEGLSGPTKFLKMSTTESEQTAATMWNSTAPTSSVITLGTHSNVNANDVTYVVYVFWETDFSKPIKYTGNANADGPFINLGGTPKFFFHKNTGSTGDWILRDTTRGTTNPLAPWLRTNVANAETQETTNYLQDAVSNGIKIRMTNGDINGSGKVIVGIAFVEPEPDSKDGAQLRAK